MDTEGIKMIGPLSENEEACVERAHERIRREMEEMRQKEEADDEQDTRGTGNDHHPG